MAGQSSTNPAYPKGTNISHPQPRGAQNTMYKRKRENAHKRRAHVDIDESSKYLSLSFILLPYTTSPLVFSFSGYTAPLIRVTMQHTAPLFSISS